MSCSPIQRGNRQRDATALRKLGVRLKHIVKRFLTGFCNQEVERNEPARWEDAKPDDVDVKLRQVMLLLAQI